jgi:hypothetical protein
MSIIPFAKNQLALPNKDQKIITMQEVGVLVQGWNKSRCYKRSKSNSPPSMRTHGQSYIAMSIIALYALEIQSLKMTSPFEKFVTKPLIAARQSGASEVLGSENAAKRLYSPVAFAPR